MESDTTTLMITLRSSDRRLFVVPETVARQSQVINRLIDGVSSEVEGIYMELTVVPVPLVTAEVLKKVITYCEKHARAADATKTEKAGKSSGTMPVSGEELRNWDKQFIDVHEAMLNKLLLAADFLEIDGLLDLICQKIGFMTRGKCHQEIGEMLHIGDDFAAMRFSALFFGKLMENNSQRLLTLTSSDGQMFVVTEAVAKESQILRGMIEEDCILTNIPLTDADSETLKKVLMYCEKHAEEEENTNGEGSSSFAPTAFKASNKDLNEWDKKFMKEADLNMLHDLLLATYNLKFDKLLDLTAKTVVHDYIAGKTVEEIRHTFNITNDFTPEEEEEIQNQYPWAFE